METMIKYHLTKKIMDYIFNNPLTTAINNTNDLMVAYNTYNFVDNDRVVYLFNDLIYTRFLELDDKMYYVTYKEFKELILNFLTNSELEDMEFIINHCIEGANNE